MRQGPGPPLAGSGVLLFFECIDEVLQDERTDDVQVIVQHFKERILLSANAVKDDGSVLSSPLAMRLAGRARGVTADGPDLLKRPIGLIEPMLALDDERVGQRQVSVQKDLLVGFEFENEIDELLFLIDVEHGEHEMFELP